MNEISWLFTFIRGNDEGERIFLPVMDLEDILLVDIMEEKFSGKNGEIGLEFCAKRERRREDEVKKRKKRS